MNMLKTQKVNSKNFFNPQLKEESYQKVCRTDKKLSYERKIEGR